ncbi:MAG TPA: GtrA family protein [Ramlibacter sp.]|nr:GtrA family protein [Ramlibacter sp.]
MRNAAVRVTCFIAVGCAAALTHLGVVVALVSRHGQLPLVANVLGWLVAFIVSFAGHWVLTFRSQQAPLWRAVRRFFGVSAAGFATNEIAYALLLQWSSLRYDVILALVLVGVAVITYLLSSRWAFLGRPQH